MTATGLLAAGADPSGSGYSVASLVPLPVILPLFGAAMTIALGRWRRVQRAISLVVLSSSLAVAIVLAVLVDDRDVIVARANGWDAPLGIPLVVDRLAAVMLVVSALMLLTVLLYAIGGRTVERDHVAFHPVYLVLAAGVSASFLTGDLFNLFVAFEMMLAASYVLISLGGRPDQLRSAMTYIVVSLLASAMFITALALLYSATGTVNMADLAVRMPQLAGGVQAAFALLLLCVFGVKAGLFPLFFWLPDSYPTAPGPVTALFAGLLTKVGVYAIIRTQTLVFGAEARQGTVLLVVAGLTMVVGVLGALAQDELKRILSFHIVGQIGYMIFGLGLFSTLGLAAVVFYIGQTVLVKTNLFLVAGLVERSAGTSRVSRLGGLVRSAPFVAAAFSLPALSLAGLPPSSGFAGKFALIDAGVRGEQYVLVAVALVVSLLTLYSMTRIWSGVFWGVPHDEPSEGGRISPLMALATSITVAASVGYVVFAGPIYDFAERAGEQLIDPRGYIEAVLERSDPVGGDGAVLGDDNGDAHGEEGG